MILNHVSQICEIFLSRFYILNIYLFQYTLKYEYLKLYNYFNFLKISSVYLDTVKICEIINRQ